MHVCVFVCACVSVDARVRARVFPTRGFPTRGFPTLGFPTRGFPTHERFVGEMCGNVFIRNGKRLNNFRVMDVCTRSPEHVHFRMIGDCHLVVQYRCCATRQRGEFASFVCRVTSLLAPFQRKLVGCCTNHSMPQCLFRAFNQAGNAMWPHVCVASLCLHSAHYCVCPMDAWATRFHFA